MILGRTNETDVEIDGIISKVLIDRGAMILMMSRDYCDEHGYEIQPLEHLVPVEGSGEENVPYLGYVEVRMHILGINSFDRRCSHSCTFHHYTLSSKSTNSGRCCIIDQVTNCISGDELQSFSQFLEGRICKYYNIKSITG